MCSFFPSLPSRRQPFLRPKQFVSSSMQTMRCISSQKVADRRVVPEKNIRSLLPLVALKPARASLLLSHMCLRRQHKPLAGCLLRLLSSPGLPRTLGIPVSHTEAQHWLNALYPLLLSKKHLVKAKKRLAWSGALFFKWFSTCRSRPHRGSHINYSVHQIFMLQFITIAKLQL